MAWLCSAHVMIAVTKLNSGRIDKLVEEDQACRHAVGRFIQSWLAITRTYFVVKLDRSEQIQTRKVPSISILLQLLSS
jgi:hypothetical protein